MAVPSLRRLAARIPLHPFELVTYGGVAAIVLVLRGHGLRIDLHSVEFMAGPMARRLPYFLLWGLALQGLSLLVARRSPRAWLREVATPGSALLWLRVCAASMATTYGYAWLKVCVPLLRDTVHDGALATLDRLLHLGVSPTAVALDLLGGPIPARALGLWYGGWLTTVAATMAWIFLSPRLAERRHFVFACTVLWLGGAAVYAALPALGPCFVAPERFEAVRDFLPGVTAMQEALARNYATMLAGRDGSLTSFNPYFGVAAMPSLHVGAHWLFTLWARRRARRLVPVFAAMTVLTFAGSLLTGWHWAVDGYAGMLLAWGAIRLADRFEPLPAAEDGAVARPSRVAAALGRLRERVRRAFGRSGLQPVELVAYGGTLLTLAFLRLNGLRYGWNTFSYQAPALLSTLLVMLPAGVVVQALARWPTGESPVAYLRNLRSGRWLANLLRVWLTVLCLPYLYTWLKVSIPLLRSDVFDAEAWAFDRWLHGGVSPVVFAIELVAGTPVAGWLDWFYGLWIWVVPIAMGVGFAARRSSVARNFAMANVLLWGLGVWIYYLVPMLGPCYFTPDVLDPVRDQLPRAVGTQGVLWSNYLVMVKARGDFLGSFSPFYGIAALPSLHVGAYAMYAFWCRRHAPRLFLAAAFATVLIFFGSLVTAWHYAVDGYVAVALAWLAVRLADRWQPVASGDEAPVEEGPGAEEAAAGPEAGS